MPEQLVGSETERLLNEMNFDLDGFLQLDVDEPNGYILGIGGVVLKTWNSWPRRSCRAGL